MARDPQTFEMTETELMDHVHWLEVEGIIEFQKQVDEIADRAADGWERDRNTPFHAKHMFARPVTARWDGYGIAATMSTNTMTITLPPWLRDRDQARFIAMEQIIEQIGDVR